MRMVNRRNRAHRCPKRRIVVKGSGSSSWVGGSELPMTLPSRTGLCEVPYLYLLPAFMTQNAYASDDRAGKSSCIKTVFQGVPVADVPYFDSTQKFEKIDYE